MIFANINRGDGEVEDFLKKKHDIQLTAMVTKLIEFQAAISAKPFEDVTEQDVKIVIEMRERVDAHERLYDQGQIHSKNLFEENEGKCNMALVDIKKHLKKKQQEKIWCHKTINLETPMTEADGWAAAAQVQADWQNEQDDRLRFFNRPGGPQRGSNARLARGGGSSSPQRGGADDTDGAFKVDDDSINIIGWYNKRVNEELKPLIELGELINTKSFKDQLEKASVATGAVVGTAGTGVVAVVTACFTPATWPVVVAGASVALAGTVLSMRSVLKRGQKEYNEICKYIIKLNYLLNNNDYDKFFKEYREVKKLINLKKTQEYIIWGQVVAEIGELEYMYENIITSRTMDIDDLGKNLKKILEIKTYFNGMNTQKVTYDKEIEKKEEAKKEAISQKKIKLEAKKKKMLKGKEALIKKKKNNIQKMKNERLIENIHKSNEVVLKILNDLNVSRQVFIKKMETSKDDPDKVERDIKKNTLYDNIEELKEKLAKLIIDVDHIAGLEEDIQNREYTKAETEKDRIKQRAISIKADEIETLRTELKSKNTLLTSLMKKDNSSGTRGMDTIELAITDAKSEEVINNKKIEETSLELAGLQEARPRDVGEIAKRQTKLQVLQRKVDQNFKDIQSNKKEFQMQTRKVKEQTAEKTQLKDEIKDIKAALLELQKDDDEVLKGGANEKNRKPVTKPIYERNRPENNFKKLKEIKIKIESIISEIDRKRQIIKSDDSEFDKVLKNEELEKKKNEELEETKMKESEKETEKEIDAIEEEAKDEIVDEISDDQEDDPEGQEDDQEEDDQEEDDQGEDEQEDDPEAIETNLQENKMDESTDIITMRKQIDEQKQSYTKINEMLTSLINVLENKYLNKTE